MIIILVLKQITSILVINKFTLFSLNLISLILGFFIASILSTLPSQTGEWGIINAAIIVTINELISKIAYRSEKSDKKSFKLINNIRIGIIYGLFVDAFKLGS
uniref:Uncharacterized protein ycf20 n=1 Tax=Caloglossa intermedia TaxID=100879 RepID=A0A1Z1M6C3_9FLOR|nr:hypothetical protein [Caloglossa intermedia]ARW61413.1 hypothetical protein [Caloglossa intermedia]